jgi:NDP-sugar pyrophosphorylase family protein
MRGFILAAGFGTRLLPITEHIPKALVTVGGKPLLARSLKFLKSNGIDTIAINSHYLSDQLKKFRNSSEIPFEIFHEETIRGTGGAFDNARSFLSGDDSFFVINVDILCQYDLKCILDSFESSTYACQLLAFPALTERGTIVYDRESECYLGTPSELSGDNTNAVPADFIGAALYKKEFLDLITPDDFSIVPVWSRARQCGMNVEVKVIQNGFWRDIGTPEAFADVHFSIIDGIVDIDIPTYLTIDKERKACYPDSIFPKCPDFCGSYSWVESGNIASGSHISRSIVLKNSLIDKVSDLHKSIITPWGVIYFNE